MKLNLLKSIKNINRNTILVGIAVIAVIITGVLIYADSSNGFSISNIFGMSPDQIGKKAIDYINDNQLSQTPAELVSASEESGVVKIKIKIGTSEFDSYVTKDGKFLFPEALDMTPKGTTDSSSDADSAQTAAPVVKTDSPLLEAFVVSRCPYGLQMQRAIADAVKNIPELAQYIKVEYIGAVSGNTITAMHGDAEAKENLRQICIREEQPAKFYNYLACQMKTGDTAGCQTSAGVDAVKLSSCISGAGRGIAYAQKDFDQSDKYQAYASPEIFLNGAKISESNYGGRSSDGVKSMVCAGFNNQPEFCSTKLNTASAAASFSETYSSSGSSNNNNVTCE